MAAVRAVLRLRESAGMAVLETNPLFQLWCSEILQKENSMLSKASLRFSRARK